MYRIKDPKVSLDFYKNVLGMELIDTMENDGFTLYFLGYQHQKDVPRTKREGLLELTHNHGTENDDSCQYHNGNDKPQGYGHIAIAVDDIEAACARFDRLGVKWQKRLTDGKMKNIGTSLHSQTAFILDPGTHLRLNARQLLD